jgi:hypothetical protein
MTATSPVDAPAAAPTSRPLWAKVTLGVAGVAAASAVAFGVLASMARSDAQGMADNPGASLYPDFQSSKASFEKDRTIAIVAGGVALVAAGVSALGLASASPAVEVSVAPLLGPGMRGVALSIGAAP